MEQNSTKKAVEQRLEAMLENMKATPMRVTPETVSAFWDPARENLTPM